MSAEIIHLFNPKVRWFCDKITGLGLGAGRRYSKTEIDRFVGQLHIAMSMHCCDDLTVDVIVNDGALTPEDRRILLNGLSTIAATAASVRDRIIAAVKLAQDDLDVLEEMRRKRSHEAGRMVARRTMRQIKRRERKEQSDGEQSPA